MVMIASSDFRGRELTRQSFHIATSASARCRIRKPIMAARLLRFPLLEMVGANSTGQWPFPSGAALGPKGAELSPKQPVEAATTRFSAVRRTLWRCDLYFDPAVPLVGRRFNFIRDVGVATAADAREQIPGSRVCAQLHLATSFAAIFSRSPCFTPSTWRALAFWPRGSRFCACHSLDV